MFPSFMETLMFPDLTVDIMVIIEAYGWDGCVILHYLHSSDAMYETSLSTQMTRCDILFKNLKKDPAWKISISQSGRKDKIEIG